MQFRRSRDKTSSNSSCLGAKEYTSWLVDASTFVSRSIHVDRMIYHQLARSLFPLERAYMPASLDTLREQSKLRALIRWSQRLRYECIIAAALFHAALPASCRCSRWQFGSVGIGVRLQPVAVFRLKQSLHRSIRNVSKAIEAMPLVHSTE